MSLERGIDRRQEQDNLGEREVVFWKHLNLITMQEAERLGISSEAPVFVSAFTKDKRCHCAVDYSPIIYHKNGLITAQHYHGHGDGGIYHYITAKKQFDEILLFAGLTTNWIAILDPVSLSMDPLLEKPLIPHGNDGQINSEAVNLLQFRAIAINKELTELKELKEGFLVTDMRGVKLFPSPTKDHPFITELGFRIIEDGSVEFFNHSSLTSRSF